MLKRVSREFNSLFPTGELNYYWKGSEYSYQFQALPDKALSNQTLKISGKKLLKKHPLEDVHKDAIALLLFGSAYSDDNQEVASVLTKCQVGEYLGKPNELNDFIKQRYIWVSRITRGAQSNSLGQMAQKFVAQYIKEEIKLDAMEVNLGARLPNITHTDPTTGRLTSFDI